MTRTGIALGSNIGDRGALLAEARERILTINGISGPILSSRLYETDPVDSIPDSPQFLNAVIEISSTIPPAELLHALQDIESTLGRPRIRPKNAPRTLDLDVLYVGDIISHTPDLLLPHPRLHLRRFVLQPLNDIRPNFIPAGLSDPVSILLRNLQDPAGVAVAAQQW